jgi:hypothetical protein
MRFVLDIESTDLLSNGLDYTVMPYRLKPEYQVHCVVVRHVDSGRVKALYGTELTKENLTKTLSKCTELIGHNLVQFDLPVLQLMGLLDYEICYPDAEQPAVLNGKPCKITDTLIWSKMLNADRFGGHSLDAWGKRLGNHKTHFEDWSKFTNEMLEYCIQDTAVNVDIFKALLAEQGTHDWSRPYSMEVKLVDLTLKQELFGFAFDRELAEKCLEDLNNKMQAIADKVNPILPKKKLTKTKADKFVPPKIKFKKNGDVSAHMLAFLERTGATLSEDRRYILFNEQQFPIQTEEPIFNEEPATIEDIDVVKSYLLSLGWVPSEIKERDIVKNTDKSIKSVEKIIETIDRYVDQTINSLFKDLRLDFLETTETDLKKTLMQKLNDTKPQFKFSKMQAQKPIFLPTTPKLTVGVEKEICPNLIALGEKAEFVKDVVQYYTYRHRRNSIAGGVLDEDDEPTTGFISAVREDNRVPTPADTLGANTGRYRHKIVCNVPRVTSLYGEQMRGLFGCGKGLYQLGYDFASLEARIMGHYVIPYKDGEALAEALVAEKPNDIHSINARKLGIERSAAKSFSYAAIYGAQPKKLSKMLGISEDEGKRLFNEYWEAVPALKELKEKVEQQWETLGKKNIIGIDGRLLSTRSKHSLINVLFQSGGAIAAKWSTVLLAKYLEERNLLGNPLVHTIAEKKVWFMIHMHDEQQLAVHPSLMRVVSYSSEEEAKSNLVSGCSAIGHGSKGAYLGFKTVPVEAIETGIKSACTELNLNVDLGFEWIPGLTWAQCH